MSVYFTDKINGLEVLLDESKKDNKRLKEEIELLASENKRHMRNVGSNLYHKNLDLEQENQRLSDAITGYLPYLPKSTASEGGAVRHSAQVIASDALKKALEEV